MTRKLIALIVLVIVMVGLAWNIERTARPVPDRDAAARQIQQHLDRLQAAGVEFLPAPDRSLPPPVAEYG